MQGRGRGNVAAERLCGALFVGLTTLKGYFYTNLGGTPYPHLFRHQIITFLTRKGIISPKLQLLTGHAEEKSLAIYRDLALADVSGEYEQAMRSFPVR